MPGTERSERQLLDDIRKLLMLLAIKAGATSDEIGRTLGLDSSTVRHLMAARVAKSGRRAK